MSKYQMLTTPAEVEAALQNLTENGRKFMTLVGERFFDFFDDGIAPQSGNWGEHMAQQMRGHFKSARSAGGVMVATKESGLWEIGQQDSEGTWWSLTPIGADVANFLAGNLETAAPAKEEKAVHADVTVDALLGNHPGSKKPVEDTTGLVTKVGRKWTYIYLNGNLIAEVLNEQAETVRGALLHL